MRRYTLEVNGKTYTLDLHEPSPDHFEVTCEEHAFEVVLVDETDLPGSGSLAKEQAVLPPGKPRVMEPAGMVATSRTPPVKAEGAAMALTAPMPGVILSVIAKPGARVKRGDPLATLEAMKMEIPLKAPRDTVIGAILVAEGQAVAHGDTLFTFVE